MSYLIIKGFNGLANSGSVMTCHNHNSKILSDKNRLVDESSSTFLESNTK